MKKGKTTAKRNFCTPPWQEIAPQTGDSRDQVFEATVLNLSKIAVSCKNYRNNILEFLQNILASPSTDEARKKYLINKIDKINRK